jgi:hypothetical protein
MVVVERTEVIDFFEVWDKLIQITT